LFYQQRIALFGKLTFFLSIGFFVLLNLISSLHPLYRWGFVFGLQSNRWHLFGALCSLAVWVIAARGKLGHLTLVVLDGAGTFAMMGGYALTGLTMVSALRGPRVDLVVMLAAMLLLMARAVVVPSTPRFTAVVGCFTATLPLFVGLQAARNLPHPPEVPLEVLIVAYDAIWSTIIVVTATLASKVIYGLRQEAHEAKRLGQYTLESKIGEGGMGAVYRAQHALLRRPTALKLLPPERMGTSNLSRFEREVQLTSRLTHPNTVAIYDYGRTPDGIFYYAMEYLDGLDLHQVVELDGPQDPSRVVHILLQVCGALSEAHGVGLVHRDIKPANIILCERGGVPDTAKVVDFGLVKQLDSDGGPSSTRDQLGMSGVSVIMGTPQFLSPEAIVSPDKIDARSDIYSLGAVAYFLLTGTNVFDGRTVVEVCSQHLQAPPLPPSLRLGRDLPRRLEEVVLSCLEKSPSKRPQSARLLAGALCDAGVAPWTEERAVAWWTRIGPRSDAPRSASGTERVAAAESTALTIDLTRRVAGPE
jgi:serine/threonine-protein kinase